MWATSVSACGVCGEKKVASMMRAHGICRACNNEKVAAQRAKEARIQVPCIQCDQVRDIDTFRMLAGTNRAVCGLCAASAQQFECNRRCAHCRLTYDDCEMLDNKSCVYCAAQSRDREQVMRVALLLRANANVHDKVKRFIYQKYQAAQTRDTGANDEKNYQKAATAVRPNYSRERHAHTHTV